MTDIPAFTTEKNYLKRDPSSGSTSMTAPNALSAWSNYVTTYPVNHNLGTVPIVRVYYEPFNNGKIFPATGRRLAGLGVGVSYGGIVCLYELSATTLTIYLESANSQTGTIPVYWVIYKDIQV